MGNLTVDQKKERFDDTYKVLLTIFTLLLSVVISWYGKTSTSGTVTLFVFYVVSICSWSLAHLKGGDFEYLVKFLGWFTLLGGITQEMLMLYLGTLELHSYYYAGNWLIALFLYYLIFRYARLFLEKDIQKYMQIFYVVYVILGAVLSSISFLGII
jgi:hypothetical protein